MGINSHYEISQNNLAPCGIICIFTQDRGNDSVCGSILFVFFIQKKMSLLCGLQDDCLWGYCYEFVESIWLKSLGC